MRSHKSKTSKHKVKLETVKASKFLLGIAGFYTLFYLLLSSINLYALKSFTAQASHALLSVFGVPATLLYGIEPTIIVQSIHAQITNLCAADLEIALLMAIILATWDRTWRQRIYGCVFGLLFILIINPVRIATVLAMGYHSGWQWADFTHDLLFRVMLLIIIVVYYFVWYTQYDRFVRIREKIKWSKKKKGSHFLPL